MASTDTAPFSSFERMISARYLRARRKEGFISVIAGFSFLGILLGVATLIIVMAVMNGFRTELLNKVLGFNGHAMVYSANALPIPDFEERARKLAETPGVIAFATLEDTADIAFADALQKRRRIQREPGRDQFRVDHNVAILERYLSHLAPAII